MTHLVNELWLGLVTSAILMSLQILCSARKVQGAQKYRNKSIGSSQSGISTHLTLTDAGPTPGFLGLFFCWLSHGYCSLQVYEQKQTPLFLFPETQKVHVLTWKQDYYQAALTNLGMVPRRLRSWKDLKNFLGVLNIIYFPAGELEKISNKQKLPTTQLPSGSC